MFLVVNATTSNQQQPNSGLITLKLWKDGFTLNDSELRLYTDPENREFLDTIKRGEIPAEIRQEIQSTEAWLDMEDRSSSRNICSSKSQSESFYWKGTHVRKVHNIFPLKHYFVNMIYVLLIIKSMFINSPSPATVGMTIPTDIADQTANESQAKKQLNVDESKPTTTLQIRLADGTSVKAQFNLTHTIDLRQYITTYPLKITVNAVITFIFFVMHTLFLNCMLV